MFFQLCIMFLGEYICIRSQFSCNNLQKNSLIGLFLIISHSEINLKPEKIWKNKFTYLLK